MRRRHLIHALTGLALATSPLLRIEAIRRGLGYAIGADPDWQAIITDYAYSFYLTPYAELCEQLSVDLGVLQQFLTASPGDRDLHQAAAGLSMILAITFASAGQFWMARRWWRTAQDHADHAGDLDTRVMTRSQQAVKALYTGHPLDEVLDLADHTIALAGNQVSAGLAGALAGRAQALALMGRRDEAVAGLHAVEEITNQMPGSMLADESMFGWPEHRLRHTESFVFTEVGDTRSASTAQQTALGLYGDGGPVNVTMVEMHRASCMIRDGHVADGIGHVADVLDRLPADRHNELIYSVARRALTVVPHTERRRKFDDVQHRLLALPSNT